MTYTHSLQHLSVSDKQLLIFTDLDGTLLDHDSYSYQPARQALSLIEKLSIPLIINSSKTRAEIIAIQQQLNICQPFISENGAAAYIPLGEAKDASLCQWQRQSFSVCRRELLPVIRHLRLQDKYLFCGFADGGAAEIAELTGLTLEQAVLAGDRDFSEPLQWQDSDVALQKFLQQLSRANLTAQQGGRFLTVMGNSANKGLAMNYLAQQLSNGHQQIIIALGDSPNDEPMLNAADIAVVIKSVRSNSICIDGPQHIIRTELSGPAGWQWAMDQLLRAENIQS